MEKGRYDRCVIGLDDIEECWVRSGCRYWSQKLRRCGYAAAKAVERERRRQAEEEARSDVMRRIRINPTGG